MIISPFSLVAAPFLFFGFLVDAQPPPLSPPLTPAFTTAPTATPSSSSTPPSIPATTTSASSSATGGTAPTTPGGPSPSATYFYTNWTIPESPIQLNQTVNYTYEYYSNVPPTEPVFLYLCQTNTSTIPAQDNTWRVLEVPFLQPPSFTNNSSASFGLNLNLASSGLDALQWPFFFCWGIHANSNDFTCESFSGSFMMQHGSSDLLRRLQGAGRAFVRDGNPLKPISIPPTPLSVPLSTQVLSLSGVPTVTGPQTATTTAATVTVSPSSNSTPASTAQPSSTSKLSTGPIVGIAVGGFALVLAILLLVFFCMRRSRRRSTASQPEHVLLTQSLHSGSRDLGGEKEGSIGILGSILETRPSSGPYDHLSSSAPYTGPAGNVRRQPTVGTMNTSLSRAISNVSGPVSPRSTARGAEAEFEEPYHQPYQDVPVYGETRHTPQLYQGALQAPFLSEPGMSDEELSRLEEEERRIDAAIAEAEGRR